MGSTGDSVRVNICGDEYSIKADVDIETTKRVADFVNQKMMELKKNSAIRDNAKIAVLSALNIAGELEEYKEKYKKTEKQLSVLQAKLNSLDQKIETVLNGKPCYM
jgi:cell division protein ZapA (FtsZ GTPase activity inhibitor)